MFDLWSSVAVCCNGRVCGSLLSSSSIFLFIQIFCCCFCYKDLTFFCFVLFWFVFCLNINFNDITTTTKLDYQAFSRVLFFSSCLFRSFGFNIQERISRITFLRSTSRSVKERMASSDCLKLLVNFFSFFLSLPIFVSRLAF